MVVTLFHFPKIIPKCLTSNPLSQNPRSQPDTHFAVDMFPYKKTGLFQKSGFKSKLPKKPGNTPLSGTYLSFLDIKTTVSTWLGCSTKNILNPYCTRERTFPLKIQWFDPVKTLNCPIICIGKQDKALFLKLHFSCHPYKLEVDYQLIIKNIITKIANPSQIAIIQNLSSSSYRKTSISFFRNF